MEMIPRDLAEKFSDWSVTEVYDKWEQFALDASIAAYDYAIRQARKESDKRISQMGEFIEALVKLNESETGKSMEETFRVYMPKKTLKKMPKKDMR